MSNPFDHYFEVGGFFHEWTERTEVPVWEQSFLNPSKFLFWKN